MDRKTVYLAGPIKGRTLEDAVDWRSGAAASLGYYNITTLSPMRFKEEWFVKGEVIRDEKADPQSPTIHPLLTDKGIVTRDRFDLQACDVVLMNLSMIGDVSIGTMIELGWADAYRKPVVAFVNPMTFYNHPMVRELVSFAHHSMEEAINTCVRILKP